MTKIVFNPGLVETDPQTHPVLVIGQVRHLSSLSLDDLGRKFGGRVSAETFENALSNLHPSPTDVCPLYMGFCTLAALPLQCSRHNSSSRSHAITKLVNSNKSGVNESIVIVCERQDVFASGCAVVRAFPTYSRKKRSDALTSSSAATVSVEFLVIDEKQNASALTAATLTPDEIACLQNAADGIQLAARIVDMPCNEMNVSAFLAEAQTVAKDLNISPLIIRGEELNVRGFGGIYGVGKAALDPPALCVLSYTPTGASKTVAWVGKGIVYDTGGLSIKGKSAMPGMKRDCGGAAAILGAFSAVVKAGFKENLHAIFCMAENAVGPLATRPDDVHKLYSGLTVEINNTDAEGRLVLSDGVVYAQRDLHADVILDMATLTGAQGIATGKFHAAVMTNSEQWEKRTVDAGRVSGDLIAPLVYCPEMHFSEFSSAIADMKNSVGDRSNAQASCAGLFIGAHLGFDYSGSWIHVDMAYPVHCGERATGYGVALLCTLFGSSTDSEMLKKIAPKE